MFHLSNTYDDKRLLQRLNRFHVAPLDDAPSTFMRYRITRSGRVIAEPLFETPCEYPRHNDAFEGRTHRYAYLNTRHNLVSFYDSITRLDLSDSSAATYTSPEAGNSFCEPVFAAKRDATAEDEGWVLSVGYQACTHMSRLVIFDATDIAAGPIAAANLRHHIPQGCHGNFTLRSR